MPPSTRSRWIRVHPLIVRVTHWINVFAMTCMIMSGWLIYNASPFFPFTFPRFATLGGWLGAATIWHFSAMWLLVANGLVYVLFGLASGHFWRRFLPLSPRAIAQDLKAALTFHLPHEVGRYNAVQRLAYASVLVMGLGAVLSGLALWKPVQFASLCSLLGGYEVARRVHFLAMSGIVLFIVVHLLLVLIVPRTLPSMITGRARAETETRP